MYDAEQVLALPRGRTLVTGVLQPPDGAATTVVAGFDARGSADRRFARTGLLRIAGAATRAAVDRSGRIVVASLHRDGPSIGGDEPRRALIVRRYGPLGGRDSRFPPRVIRLPSGFTGGFDVGVGPLGRITIAVGFAAEYTKGGVLVYRLRGG